MTFKNVTIHANFGPREGTNGVSANGVTANVMFFDKGTFWVLPLTSFYPPKRARSYLFPQSVKIHYFCSGPIRVDPICPQPRPGAARAAALQVPHAGGRGEGGRADHDLQDAQGRLYIYIYIYVYIVYNYISMYVCMYIYIYIYTHLSMYYIHMYMYIYIYIHTPLLLVLWRRGGPLGCSDFWQFTMSSAA